MTMAPIAGLFVGLLMTPLGVADARHTVNMEVIEAKKPRRLIGQAFEKTGLLVDSMASSGLVQSEHFFVCCDASSHDSYFGGLTDPRYYKVKCVLLDIPNDRTDNPDNPEDEVYLEIVVWGVGEPDSG